MNGLYPPPHECYDDDDNDENAKRDQFSGNHRRLPAFALARSFVRSQ